jgi:hypothetical protein
MKVRWWKPRQKESNKFFNNKIEAKKDFGSVKKTRKACLEFLKNLKIKYELHKLMGYPRMLYRKLQK